MIRSQYLRCAAFFGASCLLLQPGLARATFLLDSFIAPPASISADRFSWDVMYSPSIDANGNGANYPDFRGFGTKQTATAAGFSVPANSRPTNPTAYFDKRNPTITQTGDKNAFIIDPGGAGNIYSPFAPTSFRVDGSTTNFASPYNIGTISFQYQTAGTLIDYNNIRLSYTDGSGVQRSLAPTETLREHSGSTGSSFGGLTNRTAVQWDLTGLGVRTYQITFGSVTSSNSFQLATLASAATYADILPASREWSNTGPGNWSNGFRDRQGSTGLAANANGNVRFTNTAAAATVLDGNYTVGEVRFTTAAAASINSPGGFTLTTNTGFTTTTAATGAYTIGANVAFGAFNLFEINGGTVVLNGTVSGTEGFEKSGAGTLVIGGNFTAGGGVSVAGGTLRVNGTLGGGGSLDLASGAVVTGTGTIGRAFTVVAGSRLSPGNSVGILNTAAQTWEGGGIYRFELAAASNDLVRIAGGLSLAATAASPFKLELSTLTLAGNAGALESFDPAVAHTWQIATASGGVTGFDANAFTVDRTGFANTSGGSFSVALNGASLYLNYTPVPEPSTLCWLAGAGIAAVVAHRKRRRARVE